MITLYGLPLSGHTHRVAAFLSILGLDHAVETTSVDAPGLRALNPLCQVPVLKDGDLVLCDSSAILVYLAKAYGAGTQWLPEDPVGAAHVQRWLSIAAGEIRQGPAAARMVALFDKPGEPADAIEKAAAILAFMDAFLLSTPFLAADHPTIADLACYAYVARAPEGQVSLAPYANVQAWIARVEAIEGFLPMPWADAHGG
ncbi:glutathione S-transferase family protein [Tanticharoenia sakaeratensis]|uniref:Glutathione S-transferase n=1 Tax=Tanticharoenia sakaeratensis NBRC 103193 TaxID=1231623 RepID=A0A0D6MMY0_9PROT|nr:glutathione S-transferase [Tanticharoenia sakaeratensis]GAN54750.1 glutathione S-transferase [Tanticharoenia sakaeratensis NBRC 103193]GBQ23183.1 glutathione S-transferase [Tanticharoenia sakaeratensis NBRC 103193]